MDDKHQNIDRCPNQKIYYININNYIYMVPYIVEDKDKIFLKTIIPSRKCTKILLNK